MRTIDKLSVALLLWTPTLGACFLHSEQGEPGDQAAPEYDEAVDAPMPSGAEQAITPSHFADPCPDHPCQNGGECVAAGFDVACECPTGFSGELCQIASGSCADDNGGCDPLTDCEDGEAGPLCGACPGGYSGDGASGCVDIDECAASPCAIDQVCVNAPGTYTCRCEEGLIETSEGCI